MNQKGNSVMRKTVCFIVLFLSGMLTAQSRLITDVDFNRHSGVLNIREKGCYTGPIPENMTQDFSGWSPGVCHAEQKTDDLGDSYLQFDIRKPGVQFCIALPGLQAEKYYKVVFVVRNRLAGDLVPYLRQRYKPYRQPGIKFPLPRGITFATCTFPFSLRTVYGPGNPPGLFLHFSHTGIIDFKRIRVEEVSKQEYELLEMALMQRVIRKTAGTVNFLRNSTLPKGLQSGWCQLAGCYQARSVVEPDPAETGPSGEAALKLDSSADEEVGIYSEPFAANHPQKPVTVSFSCKGSGKFSALVTTDGWNAFGRVALNPRPDVWQRVSMTVRLPIRRLAAVLKIQGKGKLYVDAFRVAEQGETEYKPSGEHEVSLFLPDSDASISRIQFEDEEALLHYYVTGNADGVTLKSSVTDLYGETLSLPDCKGKSGTIRYLRNGKPYGQYRVEVQAFRNGRPVSVINEMVVTRLPRPVYWGKDAPESPFGIHMNQLESSIRAMKAGGFNWMRLHDGARHLSCWYFVEPEPGKWKFADKEIKAYRDNHFMLYGQLGGAPAWATELCNLPGFKGEYAKVYFTPLPEHEKDFANYCEVMARRYKGIIDDWFIWNEPWLPLFFHRSYDFMKKEYVTYGSVTDNAKVYARLSKLAYTGAKKGNPRCRITGFNSRTSSPEWNTGVYAAGGYAFCDELDYHVYNQNSPAGFPGDGLEDKMKCAFSEILRREGGLAKPYIMSEGQAGSAMVEEADPHTGLYKHTIPWRSLEDYHRSAEANIRFLLSHLSFGCKRVFLYTSHAYSQLGRGSELQIMLGADGFPHPGLVAMSAFAKRVEGKTFIRYHKLSEGVFAALFSDGGRTTAIFTGDPRKKAEFSCDGKFPYQCADLYGNPVPNPFYNGQLVYLTADVAPETLVSALCLKQ